MILLLHEGLDAEARELVLTRVRAAAAEEGCSVVERGPERPNAVDLRGAPVQAERQLAQRLRSLDGVVAVLDRDRPWHHVGRPELPPQLVAVDGARFGAGQVSVIAGPCSVESERQVLSIARAVKAAGAVALRGGAFKPRTSPYAFQGLGRRGLELLELARAETGLVVVTEVLDPRDVEAVRAVAGMLQIGSRNMMNYALLKEVGQAGKPVLLKRGMSATIVDFLQAAEYLAEGGCKDIVLCERGLRHFDPAVRNLLDLSVVPALRARTQLPVIVDPSHGTGRADLVPTMSVAAVAAGADGLLIEVHDRPGEALSDGDQALTPKAFEDTLCRVASVLTATGRQWVRPDSVLAL